MSTSFGRVAAVLLGLLVGGLVGGWIGSWKHAVPIGAGIGALVGVAAMALADAARAALFLRWMRGTQDTPAPRDAGFWGEVGYRVERALRTREREAATERERLRHGARNFQDLPPELREKMRASMQVVRQLPEAERRKLKERWRAMDPDQRRRWLEAGGPGLAPPPEG